MRRVLLLTAALLAAAPAVDTRADLIRSRSSGPWSAPSTWDSDAVPGEGARVQVREGHEVVYDLRSDRAIRSIHVAGALRFATDRDTRLDVGLIKIQAGDDASEDGFGCEAHMPAEMPAGPMPTLEVGTASRPVQPGRSATIRLVAIEGMDRNSCPAIVCCGGRMEIHGAPMPRTWVKLGADARAGDAGVTLAEPVPGWRVGDRVIVTATRRDRKEGATLRPGPGSVPILTEERTIRTIDGARLTLDRPLAGAHEGSGNCRGEVALLSRNVLIESADPAKARGHTMYHRGSTGSIGYAEFRGLGKEGVKGRYPIHFHMVGPSMRGASVVGASIVDSGNRWITIHATNYLVVRDCVGYRAVGHGFFLEDGTETLNVLDRNLAVQAFAGRPLADQALAFDDNAGAGFWWANSLNTFTRNAAVECDRYGYRFEASSSHADALKLDVLGSDGRVAPVDIRTLPFVRFEGNEAHAQLYGLDLGEGTGGVGPDPGRPFVLKDTRIWDALWAFRPETPSVLVEGMAIERAKYGVFNAVGDHQSYRGLTIRKTFSAGANPSPSPDDSATPRDDRPPSTVITATASQADGKLRVSGTSSDDVAIRRVVVNGRAATPLVADFSRWEISIDEPPSGVVTARAEDAAGNVEATPHVIQVGSQ